MKLPFKVSYQQSRRHPSQQIPLRLWPLPSPLCLLHLWPAQNRQLAAPRSGLSTVGCCSKPSSDAREIFLRLSLVTPAHLCRPSSLNSHPHRRQSARCSVQLSGSGHPVHAPLCMVDQTRDTCAPWPRLLLTMTLCPSGFIGQCYELPSHRLERLFTAWAGPDIFGLQRVSCSFPETEAGINCILFLPGDRGWYKLLIGVRLYDQGERDANLMGM
eukprot:superscaffoldBa00000070_g1114